MPKTPPKGEPVYFIEWGTSATRVGGWYGGLTVDGYAIVWTERYGHLLSGGRYVPVNMLQWKGSKKKRKRDRGRSTA